MILKNKFFVGQVIYLANEDMNIKIRGMYQPIAEDILIYELGNIAPVKREDLLIVTETDIYESKEAYEAEKNQIRVGDDFYFCESSTIAYMDGVASGRAVGAKEERLAIIKLLESITRTNKNIVKHLIIEAIQNGEHLKPTIGEKE